MADHDVHGHASPDDQYRETPSGAGYEHTDARVWGIAKFLIGLTVAAVVIHLGLALLFWFFAEQRQEQADPRYPLAVREEQRLPPEPRLQRFPREDIMNFRLAEEDVLRRYGWVDRDAGTVHIPIVDAMKLTLERGLPVRPQPAGAPAESPGNMPSDASAGRVMEKRRQ